MSGGRPGAAEFEAAGVYDPAAPDAGQRLALLECLVDLGVTLPDFALVPPDEVVVLASLVGLFPERELLTVEEFAARAGTTPEVLSQFWRAAGFPDLEPGVPSMFSYGLEVFSALANAVELFGLDATLQFMRVLGSAAARVADAGVSLFVATVGPAAVARDPSLVELARANAEGVGYVPALVAGFDVLLRRHMFAARRMDEMIPGVDVQRRCIAFVDLVGSTGLTMVLSPQELADAFSAFDAICGDIVAVGGGRVVKLIGDEVMFATGDTTAAVEIALRLVDAFTDHDTLPPVRAAIATGDVVTRAGDYSGAVVNLAARAVKLARPGSLLVDEATLDALDCSRFESRSIGAFSLKGFAERVPLYRVRPRD